MNDGKTRCPRGHVAIVEPAGPNYPEGWVVPVCACGRAGLPHRKHSREPRPDKEPSQGRLSVLFSLLALCLVWSPS